MRCACMRDHEIIKEITSQYSQKIWNSTSIRSVIYRGMAIIKWAYFYTKREQHSPWGSPNIVDVSEGHMHEPYPAFWFYYITLLVYKKVRRMQSNITTLENLCNWNIKKRDQWENRKKKTSYTIVITTLLLRSIQRKGGGAGFSNTTNS